MQRGELCPQIHNAEPVMNHKYQREKKSLQAPVRHLGGKAQAGKGAQEYLPLFILLTNHSGNTAVPSPPTATPPSRADLTLS